MNDSFACGVGCEPFPSAFNWKSMVVGRNDEVREHIIKEIPRTVKDSELVS